MDVGVIEIGGDRSLLVAVTSDSDGKCVCNQLPTKNNDQAREKFLRTSFT